MTTPGVQQTGTSLARHTPRAELGLAGNPTLVRKGFDELTPNQVDFHPDFDIRPQGRSPMVASGSQGVKFDFVIENEGSKILRVEKISARWFLTKKALDYARQMGDLDTPLPTLLLEGGSVEVGTSPEKVKGGESVFFSVKVLADAVRELVAQGGGKLPPSGWDKRWVRVEVEVVGFGPKPARLTTVKKASSGDDKLSEADLGNGVPRL